MCGRFYLDVTFEELLTRYDLRRLEMDYAPKTEIFPTDTVLSITQDEPDRFTALQWGIRQPFLKQVLFNARSESLFEKALFKNLALMHKCIIPASGYFEWQSQNKLKIKHRIFPVDRTILSFAGLWGQFTLEGKNVKMGVILTRDAVGETSLIHPRMPVMLSDLEARSYLTMTNRADLEDLIKGNRVPTLAVEIG